MKGCLVARLRVQVFSTCMPISKDSQCNLNNEDDTSKVRVNPAVQD